MQLFEYSRAVNSLPNVIATIIGHGKLFIFFKDGSQLEEPLENYYFPFEFEKHLLHNSPLNQELS